MRKISGLLSSGAAVVIIALLAVSVSGATQGTVVYRVQVTGLPAPSAAAGTSSSTASVSYVVTETVSPGPNASFVTLFLGLKSNSGNLTYTRLANASTQLQPFLPTITNQSFSYRGNGTSLSASIQRNGTSHVTFQAQTYTLTSYAIAVTIIGEFPNLSELNTTGTDLGLVGLPSQASTSATSNQTITVNCSVYAFPSGLVYSVKADAQGMPTLSLTLLSTNLPLSGPNPSTTIEVASLGVGAGAIGSALALGVGVRHRNQTRKPTEDKPEHWVD